MPANGNADARAERLTYADAAANAHAERHIHADDAARADPDRLTSDGTESLDDANRAGTDADLRGASDTIDIAPAHRGVRARADALSRHAAIVRPAADPAADHLADISRDDRDADARTDTDVRADGLATRGPVFLADLASPRFHPYPRHPRANLTRTVS